MAVAALLLTATLFAARRSVTIAVDAQNRFSYRDENNGDATRIRVKRNDTVRFECRSGACTVDFGNRSPFAGGTFSAPRGQAVEAAVRGNAAFGVYKYTVTVRNPGQPDRVQDPEVEIEQ
ncbi:MAG: hypothetical protein JST93_34135 [Acidobacteria bacterium]|nr:hypothetical protein [Acidobacteriota bacterium]